MRSWAGAPAGISRQNTFCIIGRNQSYQVVSSRPRSSYGHLLGQPEAGSPRANHRTRPAAGFSLALLPEARKWPCRLAELKQMVDLLFTMIDDRRIS